MMMERPTGPPLGAATQSTGRPMIDDNGIPRLTPLNTVRKIPPNPIIQHAPSNSSPSVGLPISGGQLVALVREAMKHALEENQTKAAEASGVSNELKPGVTIDLSHKQIQKFPEEVVDIIKNDLERLALSHNQIYAFPSRLSECTSLRYLNVRSNIISDFPLCICELTSLEILDLGRNRLKVLPPELVKLTSLKVLSVQKNKIEDLPICLADMISLQVLKLKGNPIRFPPKEVLQPPESSPPNSGFQEGDMDEVAVTSQIKRFLRQKAINDRSETESGGEESSEGAETPRPIKRVMSGRFPVKVNGTDVPDLRSPGMPRAPPIPSRSHYRGLSQQNASIRRPGVMPLTIGSANERLRSNSENLASARSIQDRSRRMGIVSRKPSDLGTVDETRLNRYSHYRGLSHGSAMSGTNGTNGSINSRSPASPADSTIRATYIRRLSSLPERKRKSTSPDPIIEGAQGILFALFQVHPLIQNLLGLARDGTDKRTSLERVFYNATTHVEELDRDLQNYITYSEEDEEVSPRSNENVHRACSTCVSAYIHICSLLARNVETLLDNGDPRYIRHLLLLLYGSLVEVRNAGQDLFLDGQMNEMMSEMRISRISEESEDTIRAHSSDKSITPTRDRPAANSRLRSATVVQHSSNFRATAEPTPPPLLLSGSRFANVSGAAPRSGESYIPSNPASGRIGIDFTDEDRLFEKIFLQLQRSSEMAIRNLPIVHNHFCAAMKLNGQMAKPETTLQFWHVLIQRNWTSLQNSEALRDRLSQIILKDPGFRTQSSFWELCHNFMQSYAALAEKIKDAKTVTTLLPWVDVIGLLRPLQKEVKACTQLIQQSPWSSNPNSMSNSSSYNAQSPVSQMPLPMTPQSAALGPAVQATVPSTSSTSYNAMFSGNVFERADALLSINGSSSRAGTMNSALGSNGGIVMPTSAISPMKSVRPRFNSNGNISF